MKSLLTLTTASTVLLASMVIVQQSQITRLRADDKANSEAALELEQKYGEVPNEPADLTASCVHKDGSITFYLTNGEQFVLVNHDACSNASTPQDVRNSPVCKAAQ